jgi:hypothetical protein
MQINHKKSKAEKQKLPFGGYTLKGIISRIKNKTQAPRSNPQEPR